MANNIFTSAIKGAQLSVRVNNDGDRYIDRGSSGPPYRGGGNDGGRWQRGGGGFRGNRGGFRGRGRGRGPRRGRGGRGRGFNNNNYDRGDTNDMDDDGDANMDSYGSFGGGAGNRDRRRERSPDNSRCDWKVTIVDGRKHNRDWLLNRLASHCDGDINPVNYRPQGSDAVFFVNDDRIASALEDASNRITQKDGTKIVIRVASTKGGGGGRNAQQAAPANPQEEMETLKQCLGKRYDMNLNKLDLSKLFADPMLNQPKLYQPQYMNKILDLIHALCPTLKILDLSNNRIIRLENLTNLADKCPELEELILSNNDIRFTGELSKIANHKKLTSLWFVGNPGQLQYSADKAKYLADVRRRLPNLVKLDDAILPKEVKFTLEEETTETSIPEHKDTFPANPQDFELVKSFIQNYFDAYDADRQCLLQAYHNDASFSLCCNSTITAKASASNSLAFYIKHSRNIRNIQNSKQKRIALLKNKKLNIVAFLSELPQTKHWMESFTLDLTFTTPRMLIFTVQGIFIEGKDELKKPRGFSRTFIAQRDEEGGGFQIVNDQLHIRNLTNDQADKVEDAKKALQQPATVTPQEAQLSDAHKEMITRFSAESKMNIKFSTMCLEAAAWDFNEAAAKFLELKTAGSIPPEAFQ